VLGSLGIRSDGGRRMTLLHLLMAAGVVFSLVLGFVLAAYVVPPKRVALCLRPAPRECEGCALSPCAPIVGLPSKTAA
jgi:hypothetical protein